MTKKIYFEDPYIRNFIADVIGVKEEGGKYHVELSQTAFYPEGGGQPCDLGTIEGVPVVYVYEDAGRVFHVLEQLPGKHKEANCQLDWDRRFDHMQQHLGQHLFSGILAKMYGAETVSFHLGSEGVSIDLDQALGAEEIREAEKQVNRVILANLEVEMFFPTEEELEKLPLRKLPADYEQIRLVVVPDVDIIPCGGTHPYTTGEVGLFKVLNWSKQRTGIRISFLCGQRALTDYAHKNDAINKISMLLSVPAHDTVAAVENLCLKFNDLEKEYKGLKEQLLAYEAEALIMAAEVTKAGKVVKKIFEQRDMRELKSLVAKLTAYPGMIVLFGIRGHNKAQLLFARAQDVAGVNIVELLHKAMVLVDGKGGGNQYNAQGGGKLPEKVNDALEYAYNELLK
ncbi:MAG: alanyl-tRNA editing protein [bacterium]|jgi:alanyl-tRNA synthetase